MDSFRPCKRGGVFSHPYLYEKPPHEGSGLVHSDAARVELDEGGEVLFLLRGFVVDIADERRVEQRLGLLPEVVPGFPVPLGVGDEDRDQLQNILLAVDIRKGVVMVGLLEVDGIEYLHLIAIAEHELSALHGDAALRLGFVKTEKGECHLFFVQKLSVFTSLHISRFILSSRVSLVVWLK